MSPARRAPRTSSPVRHADRGMIASNGGAIPRTSSRAYPNDPFRRGIPVDEPQVAIEQQIRERHPIDLKPEPRRHLIALRLSPLPRRDVVRGAHDTHELTRRAADPSHLRVDPDA